MQLNIITIYIYIKVTTYKTNCEWYIMDKIIRVM